MEDYYDLDSILASEEKVPTRFLYEGKGLGYLDPGSVDNDLLKDCKLELPIWLAKTLVRKNLAKITLPKAYETKFRSDLGADATVVDLHRYPYYYHLGHSLCVMLKDVNLLQELGHAFAARYRMILDKSLNMQSHGSAEFSQSLAHTEVKLFHVGYNSTQEFDKWKTTKEDKISTAASISNSSRKRKRNGTSEEV
eukprot:Phypoly_transcript_20847.p1 GENE.Phypoly_transcript_20847~~Phypoly_transcript_20847.p1  ORF type:complete len:204 (-),score=15.29 Phypoly_transcript_20847:55-639(-)